MVVIKELLQNQSLLSVEKTATVQVAVEFMAAKNIGAVPVLDGTRLVGIFSERDVINRVIARSLNPTLTPISSVMTTNLVVAQSDDTIEDCLRKMKQAKCRHLPVIENGNLVGIISLRDLLQVDISEKDDKIEFLNNYMFHTPPGLEKRYSQ
jgi:CBS domain-containing protein